MHSNAVLGVLGIGASPWVPMGESPPGENHSHGGCDPTNTNMYGPQVDFQHTIHPGYER